MTTPNEPKQPDPFGPDGPEVSQTFSEPVANTPPAQPHPPAEPAPPPPPPYAAPGQSAPPAPASPAAAKPNTWMNIAALVTGILGLAIIPVIFGHLGVSQANKGRADYKGMGIAGLILGYLEILGWIILIVALVAWSTTATSN